MERQFRILTAALCAAVLLATSPAGAQNGNAPSDGPPPDEAYDDAAPQQLSGDEYYEGPVYAEGGQYGSYGRAYAPRYRNPWAGGELLAGFEFTFLKAHNTNNVAFTETRSDGVSFSSENETAFDYDLEFAPRLWMHYVGPTGFGARVRYSSFDGDVNGVTGSPDADGFSTLNSPIVIDGLTIPMSAIPGDVLNVSTQLEFQTIDFETTKRACFDNWALMATGGLRYATINQQYNSTLRNGSGQLVSNANFAHRFDGFGPTLSVEARRSFGLNLRLFTAARTSLLYGNGKSSTTAFDNLNLSTPFTATRETDRDDLLPISELQVGFEWAREWYLGGHMFCRGTLEGQLWQGAGSASSEEGDLGFLGFSFSMGVTL